LRLHGQITALPWFCLRSPLERCDDTCSSADRL